MTIDIQPNSLPRPLVVVIVIIVTVTGLINAIAALIGAI